MPRITGEVRSQRYVNEDFSIIKRLRFAESHSLTLKADLVNAFNRHVFSRPDAGPADGTFGAVFGTVDSSRKVQFALRYPFCRLRNCPLEEEIPLSRNSRQEEFSS